MLILTTPNLTNRSIGKFVDAPEIDCVRGNSNGWMVMVAQGRGGQRLRIRPAKLFQHCFLLKMTRVFLHILKVSPYVDEEG